MTQSMVMSGRITEEASPALVKEVFSIMQIDKVGMQARRDPLIVCLGNQWMEQNIGNQLMCGSYTSAIMRLVANMLLHLQKTKVEHSMPVYGAKSNENLMWDYLRPQHFDSCVQPPCRT